MAHTLKYSANTTNQDPRLSRYLKCWVVLLALCTSNFSHAGGISDIINRNISNDITRELRDRVSKRNQEKMDLENKEAQANKNKDNKELKAVLTNQSTEDEL